MSVNEPLLYLSRHGFHLSKYQTFSGEEAVPHFYSLEEVKHQKEAELYMQRNQHVTWKYLADAPRRVKVAVEPCPRDEARLRRLIDQVVHNHSEVYMHQDDIEAEIKARQKALEARPDTKHESYLEPNDE